MFVEQLEEITMIGAQTIASAYRQPRSQILMSMEVTLEPSRAYATSGRRVGAVRWCPSCGHGFRMVTAVAAAAMADISFRTLYRWAETEEVHFSATDEGALLICLDSLLDRLCAQETREFRTA